jgi:hypothetical protein
MVGWGHTLIKKKIKKKAGLEIAAGVADPTSLFLLVWRVGAFASTKKSG